MPVDKFGRNEDRATTTVYTGMNTANLTNTFLRRDGGSTSIGAIDWNINIIKNVSDPLSNQDVATKNYVDTNDFVIRRYISRSFISALRKISSMLK